MDNFAEEILVPNDNQEPYDDFGKPPFIFNGRDLSKEDVSHDPPNFGRHIARILFGGRNYCELIDSMMEPEISRNPKRIAADELKVEFLRSRFVKYVGCVCRSRSSVFFCLSRYSPVGLSRKRTCDRTESVGSQEYLS